MSRPTSTPAWNALNRHQDDIANQQIKDLFARDSDRFNNFSLRFNDILFDFSKNLITEQSLSLLIELANQCDLETRISAMFNGDKINNSENRAVLHTALRNQSDRAVYVDGKDVMPEVRAEIEKMHQFCNKIHQGQWQGFNGKTISNIVHIGIGGSELGPKMVCNALLPYARPEVNVHFVSNIDSADILETLRPLNPETTLFIIASKTFSTQETLTNAHTARNWITEHFNTDTAVASHFVAVSTHEARVTEFGIKVDNMFGFWDWVGGRFSLWSTVGLPIAAAVGMDNFQLLLKGAYEIDEHFRSAPFRQNIPVIMALIGVWYINFFNYQSHAILPYDQSLNYLADFLQQGDMESNGKTVDINGEPVDYLTGPIIWGQPGTNGQHAFYQLMHQGSQKIPCDFLAPAKSHYHLQHHHDMLISNFLAQPEALMMGKSLSEVMSTDPDYVDNKALANAKVFAGNKPSNSFLFKQLTPATLGSLIALYEHKIFVQGAIWHINSFDQWGVELGKVLAKAILPELTNDKPIQSHDGSTNGLINYYKTLR